MCKWLKKGFWRMNSPEFIFGYIIGHCDKNNNDYLSYNEIRELGVAYESTKLYTLNEMKRFLNSMQNGGLDPSEYSDNRLITELCRKIDT